MVVQAFNESEKQHGVRYNYKVLVADGDFSVVKNIMEERIGSVLTSILSDAEAIKTATRKKAFSIKAQ